jgi:hypothetical protein
MFLPKILLTRNHGSEQLQGLFILNILIFHSTSFVDSRSKNTVYMSRGACEPQN